MTLECGSLFSLSPTLSKTASGSEGVSTLSSLKIVQGWHLAAGTELGAERELEGREHRTAVLNAREREGPTEQILGRDHP